MEIQSEEHDAEILPEWHLVEEAEPHNFTNINPRSVFALALLAAIFSLMIVFCGRLLIEFAIDMRAIPEPPALGQYVS